MLAFKFTCRALLWMALQGIPRVVGNEDGIASPIPYAPLLF